MKYSNQNDDLMLIDPQLNRIGGSGKSSRAYLVTLLLMPPADQQPGSCTPGADVDMKEDPGAGDGASPTQAASAEDGAAYHSTVREEPTSVCGMICDVWPLLLCQGLDATWASAGLWSVLYSSIRST